MKVLHLLFVPLAAGALACGAAAHAADASPEALRVLTGGVGRAQQLEMRQAARDYSVELSFADSIGQYVADVDVSIRDAHGKALVDTTSDGPLMLVDLPPGRYQVEATYAGRTRRQALVVPPRGHRKLGFSWPSAADAAQATTQRR